MLAVSVFVSLLSCPVTSHHSTKFLAQCFSAGRLRCRSCLRCGVASALVLASDFHALVALAGASASSTCSSYFPCVTTVIPQLSSPTTSWRRIHPADKSWCHQAGDLQLSRVPQSQALSEEMPNVAGEGPVQHRYLSNRHRHLICMD